MQVYTNQNTFNIWNAEGIWKVTNLSAFPRKQNLFGSTLVFPSPGFWFANISFLAFTCGQKYIYIFFKRKPPFLPVHKCGAAQALASSRPISILSIASNRAETGTWADYHLQFCATSSHFNFQVWFGGKRKVLEWYASSGVAGVKSLRACSIRFQIRHTQT